MFLSFIYTKNKQEIPISRNATWNRERNLLRAKNDSRITEQKTRYSKIQASIGQGDRNCKTKKYKQNVVRTPIKMLQEIEFNNRIIAQWLWRFSACSEDSTMEK